MEFPRDPASALLDTDPRATGPRGQADTRTHVFTAALFIIAKTRSQPRCPHTGEQIPKCRVYARWQVSHTQRIEVPTRPAA